MFGFFRNHFGSTPQVPTATPVPATPQTPPVLQSTEATKLAGYLETIVHDGKLDAEIRQLYDAAAGNAPKVFAELWQKVCPAIDVFVAASPGKIDDFAWPAVKGYINSRIK
jgi:hypothetical protein